MSAIDDFRFRDRMLHAISQDGQFRAVVVKANVLAESARQKHELNPLASLILSELLLGALLCSTSLKGEDRLVLRIDCAGPLNYAVAEASASGEVRGYLGNADLQPASEDPAEMVQKAIGHGILQVTRLQPPRPVTSSVMLHHSLPVKDLATYFAVSEQIPTAIKMDVVFNDDFHIKHALAVMVQAMPGASEEAIVNMENNFVAAPSLGALLDQGQYIDEILKSLVQGHEFRELSRKPVDFFCRCSKESFMEKMALLPENDLLSMIDEGSQELVCHYCNQHYTISSAEISQVLLNKRKSSN